jgi:succinate dehydrogenase hydrophobic anchor subunit
MDGHDARPEVGIAAKLSSDFAWRATRVLGILGVLSLLLALLALMAGDGSVGPRVTAGAVLVGSIGELALAMTLHYGRAWAEPWAKAALLIVAATGLAHTVIGLANSSLWIPLDTLMAVWALLAGDHAPPTGWLLRPAGLGLVVLVVVGEAAVPLGTAAAGLANPAPDPNAVLVVHNLSARAVVVLAGDLFDTRSDSGFAAPCGGVVRLPIVSADYQSDGRLMAMIAIDQSGQLDAWTNTSQGPSETYLGSYSMTPIWSHGDLAGTLPLALVVHPDFTVDASLPAPAPCTPNPSAMPGGD